MEKSKGKLIVSIIFRSIIILFVVVGLVSMLTECEFFVELMTDSLGLMFLDSKKIVYYPSEIVFGTIQIGLFVLFFIELKNLIIDIIQLSSLRKANKKENYVDLETLSALKEKGLITPEEFEEKRKQIVKNL